MSVLLLPRQRALTVVTAVCAVVASTAPAAIAASAARPTAAAAASAPSAARPTAAATAAGSSPVVTELTITGHGYGHGRGMGQYGAYGYAVRYHWTFQKILGHFYGGATLSHPAVAADTSLVSVRLTAWDGKDVKITSKSWFQVGSAFRFDAGQSAILRYTGGSTYTVYRGGTGCRPSTQTKLGTVTSAVVRSSVAAPGTDTSAMLTVCRSGLGTVYRGRLAFLSVNHTMAGRRLVNTLKLGDYLKSVVPAEMPASWADHGSGWGAQALQAQGVAARSYAAAGRRYSYARTCDTIACQVYRGVGRTGETFEDPRSTAAVNATAGIAITRAGTVQYAEFSASTGGYTAGGTFPAVSDLGDAVTSNPYRTWAVTVSTAPLARLVTGTLTGVTITRTDGHGRALTVRLTAAGGTTTITGDQLRVALGLRSTMVRW